MARKGRAVSANAACAFELMLCLREKALVSSFSMWAACHFFVLIRTLLGGTFGVSLFTSLWHVVVCFSFYPSFSIQPASSFIHAFHPSRLKAKHQERCKQKELNRMTKGPVTIHTRTHRHTPHPAQPAPCLCSTSRPFSRLANHSPPLLLSYMKQKSITLRAGHTNKPVP